VGNGSANDLDEVGLARRDHRLDHLDRDRHDLPFLGGDRVGIEIAVERTAIEGVLRWIALQGQDSRTGLRRDAAERLEVADRPRQLLEAQHRPVAHPPLARDPLGGDVGDRAAAE